MPFEIWTIGKTRESYLQAGVDEYARRVGRYLAVQAVTVPDPRNAAKLDPATLRQAEARAVLDRLQPKDFLILLDERGKTFTSREFAAFLESRLQDSGRRTVFLIGGAWGFDGSLRERCQAQVSLSPMTFSHQLVRLIFWEQLYRAVAIINGLPYHND